MSTERDNLIDRLQNAIAACSEANGGKRPDDLLLDRETMVLLVHDLLSQTGEPVSAPGPGADASKRLKNLKVTIKVTIWEDLPVSDQNALRLLVKMGDGRVCDPLKLTGSGGAQGYRPPGNLPPQR